MLTAQTAWREVAWTAVYAYLGSWISFVLYYFPGDDKSSNVWNFPFLFFMYLQLWGEMNPPCISNPAGWLRNYVFDDITQKLPRRTPSNFFPHLLILCALDVLGFVLGYLLYVFTLRALQQPVAIDIKLQVPTYAHCSWLYACFTEFVVTLGTYLATPLLKYFFSSLRSANARTVDLFSNLIGVYVFLVFGLETTGAWMNPASTLGLALVAIPWRIKQQHGVGFGQVFTLLTVYVLSPLAAALFCGFVEAAMEIGGKSSHETPVKDSGVDDNTPATPTPASAEQREKQE